MATTIVVAGKPVSPSNTPVVEERVASSGSHTSRDIETTALVVNEARADFTLTPVILDEVRGDEVLIEMKYSGICKLTIWEFLEPG